MASVLSVTVIVRDAKSCAKSTPVKHSKARREIKIHLDMGDYRRAGAPGLKGENK
jgi:hypothetical protein